MTCLRCGHQIELIADSSGTGRLVCACGADFSYPDLRYTGTAPSERLAERSRSKAFRAAGVVKNVGGFALGISLLGILFFPLGIVGAAIGVYCLTMLRGPIGRYSGRQWAILALAIGVTAFTVEGSLVMSWLEEKRLRSLTSAQESAAEDLKRLRRAQRLYRATHDVYGNFEDFRFQPSTGRYTIYLGTSFETELDKKRFIFPADRDGSPVIHPLPAGVVPEVTPDDFTAVAVCNLDGDEGLDVWVMTARGDPQHVADDIVLESETVISIEGAEGKGELGKGAGSEDEPPIPDGPAPAAP